MQNPTATTAPALSLPHTPASAGRPHGSRIVDGCSLNNRFWVFYAATTTVDLTLTVIDTFADPASNTKTYHNPLGTTQATSITDSDAFHTCS